MSKKDASSAKKPKPRESALNTVQLTLEILRLLEPHRRLETSDIYSALPEHLRRSLRTVQRHLDSLSDAIPDIERVKSGTTYSYKWKPNAHRLLIGGLTAEQALLLRLSKEHLNRLLPPSITKSMDGLFNEADNIFRDIKATKRVNHWQDKVASVPSMVPLLPPKIVSGVLETVSEALYSDQWLDVDYVNADGEKKTGKRVAPLALVRDGERLRLVVRFEGHDNIRHLAVHRILKATNTTLPHKERRDFDLKAHLESGDFGIKPEGHIELVLEIDKKSGLFLTESRLSKDQTVEDLGDRLRITATVALNDQLVWWLLHFGKRAKVVSPSSLADRLAREAGQKK